MWWETGRRVDFPEAPTSLAVRPLGTTSLTASPERHFSRLRLTCGLLRGRLLVDKVGRIAFLYDVFKTEEDEKEDEEGSFNPISLTAE